MSESVNGHKLRDEEQVGFPLVRGKCPACDGESLFLGAGGFVTCSRADCPNPLAVGFILHAFDDRLGRSS